MSRIAREPDAVGGAHDGDGGQHRAGAGDEDESEAETEDEPAALGWAGGSPASRAKGRSRSIAHRRDDQAQPDHAEDHQADPPQQVLGQARGR